MEGRDVTRGHVISLKGVGCYTDPGHTERLGSPSACIPYGSGSKLTHRHLPYTGYTGVKKGHVRKFRKNRLHKNKTAEHVSSIMKRFGGPILYYSLKKLFFLRNFKKMNRS